MFPGISRAVDRIGANSLLSGVHLGQLRHHRTRGISESTASLVKPLGHQVHISALPFATSSMRQNKAPLTKLCVFLRRMIAIFDEDGGGDVDFQEFVSGLSAFSSKGNKEEKLRFAFKVYDIDRDGYISNGELFIVLKMMVGSNLKDQQLQQVRSQLVQLILVPTFFVPALPPSFPAPKTKSQKGLPLIYVSQSSPLDRG